MAEYRLSPRAHRDLDGVFDYTVANWGLPQAMRYTDLIEAACADLAEAPQQALDCANIRPGYHRYRPNPASTHGCRPSFVVPLIHPRCRQRLQRRAIRWSDTRGWDCVTTTSIFMSKDNR